VIVRISNEGQYELQGDDEEALKVLDNAAVAACEVENEQKFHEAFARLLDFVRTQGRAVPDDQLAGSDLILPPPDTSLQEAKAEFTGEGLIPS
jgi:PspAA-like protein